MQNTPREDLIRMTNIMQQNPEFYLQSPSHLKALIDAIEVNFESFPKGCAFLANQLITIESRTASQFSGSFVYKVSQICFTSESSTTQNNLNLLTLLTRIVSAVPALFSSSLKKGSFLGKLLAMDIELFNENEKEFSKALLCASKLIKICGKSCLVQEKNHLSLAKRLIFDNFHIIQKDAFLLTNYLGLLGTICQSTTQQDTLKFKVPQKLFSLFENAQNLPSTILPAVAKLIVCFCPANIDLLQWLLVKAFKVNGGLAFQMILDAFDTKFLCDNADYILKAVSQCQDTETMAYFLKTLDHVLCASNSPSPSQVLRWLSTSQILSHIHKLYFANIRQTSEPVKGAILDFLASLLFKGALLTINSTKSNVIQDKLSSIGLIAEIEANKHLLKKNLIVQQRNNNNEIAVGAQNPIIPIQIAQQ